MHRKLHGPSQFFVVDLAVLHHVREVERAQVARFIGQQGLLAAGVGRFDHAGFRGRVAFVEPVDEDETRLPRMPGLFDELPENLGGALFFDHLVVSRVDQVVFAVGGQGLHEFVGNGHREIEVLQDGEIRLGLDEIHDVRVIDPQDRHVGAAAGAALL